MIFMLVANALSFAYKKQSIFSDVSFSLKERELLHVCGDNGSGKSTLLKILAGLLVAQKGDLKRTSDVLVHYLNADFNAHYLDQTAIFNLHSWVKLLEVKKSEKDLEEYLRIWGYVHPIVQRETPVSKFSTGMRRKLALSRMFLQEKSLLILDEPTNGIDQHGVTKFCSFLERHLDQGGAAVVTGFNLEPINHLVSKKLYLKK